jgi:hypothetical protein
MKILGPGFLPGPFFGIFFRLWWRGVFAGVFEKSGVFVMVFCGEVVVF